MNRQMLFCSMFTSVIDIVKVESIPTPLVKVVSDNISTPRTSSEFCLDSFTAFPFAKSPSNPKVFFGPISHFYSINEKHRHLWKEPLLIGFALKFFFRSESIAQFSAKTRKSKQTWRGTCLFRL